MVTKIESSKQNNIIAQVSFFKKQEAWLLMAIIAIGTGGLFAWISYIAPLVTNVSGLDPNRVPIIMILIGIGMFFGNLLGGKMADTISPTKAAIASFSAMAICLVFVYFVSPFQWSAYIMAFITGLVSFTIGPPTQMMLIRTAKGAETLAAAGGQAAFNLGNTLGAYLGGIPITYGLMYNTPSLVGVGMATIGALLACVFLVQFVQKNRIPSAD
ncbi:hypothetical protein L950_0220505 [Sphingobacterium sp. IITKGP-BTPF85]|nr:hypothetical protein L950_0220505 [Sphingobacterium sp. IITKGP-BTPF85]